MSSFQKCCICDGKLVNGRCVDCGMRLPAESREANLNVDSQKNEYIKQHADAAGKADKYGYKKVLGIIKIIIILAVLITITYEAVEEYRFQTHEEVVDLGEWFEEESEVEEE